MVSTRPRTARGIAAAGLWLVSIAVVQGETPTEIGAPAPDFSATGIGGQAVRLADFRGRPLVLLMSRAHW